MYKCRYFYFYGIYIALDLFYDFQFDGRLPMHCSLSLVRTPGECKILYCGCHNYYLYSLLYTLHKATAPHWQGESVSDECFPPTLALPHLSIVIRFTLTPSHPRIHTLTLTHTAHSLTPPLPHTPTLSHPPLHHTHTHTRTPSHPALSTTRRDRANVPCISQAGVRVGSLTMA